MAKVVFSATRRFTHATQYVWAARMYQTKNMRCRRWWTSLLWRLHHHFFRHANCSHFNIPALVAHSQYSHVTCAIHARYHSRPPHVQRTSTQPLTLSFYSVAVQHQLMWLLKFSARCLLTRCSLSCSEISAIWAKSRRIWRWKWKFEQL